VRHSVKASLSMARQKALGKGPDSGSGSMSGGGGGRMELKKWTGRLVQRRAVVGTHIFRK
jgi:hypothetical protein